MSSENAAVAVRWFEEVWNGRRRETIDELVTPESVCQTESGPMRGAEEFKDRMYDAFLGAFPDLSIAVEGTVAQGDEVVVRWTCRATHTGDGLGIAPTGRRVEFRGMTWMRIRGGKLLEGWDCWNVSGLMQSLQQPAEAP